MSEALFEQLFDSLDDTLLMVGVASLVALLLGTLLGVVLFATTEPGLWRQPALNRGLGALVNATRSTPFIILMVAIIPFTRLAVGTSIGTGAAIVPLAVAAIPFFARLVEAALREVDRGLIEAALAMGATPRQILGKVLLPEALPALARGLTLTVISLIGYSAMAGAVGGGGLGDLGIRYGYQRFNPTVMAAVVVVLIILVQLVQSLGDFAARRLQKK
ncbi:MAG TPA: methionine ABC transporter permease [Aliidongia sp.]|nr:methionine ABC transporter permease [Aliidongia sp.]